VATAHVYIQNIYELIICRDLPNMLHIYLLCYVTGTAQNFHAQVHYAQCHN